MVKGPEITETVLIVEDDESISDAMLFNLRKEGYRCLIARDGLEGLRMLKRESPSLMVLDLMLPKMDGWKLCEQVREEGYDLPIIICSARTSEFDKVEGLGMGADDYLAKPFGMAELVARVKANLRRPYMDKHERSDRIEAGPLKIDSKRKQVYANDEPLDLTPKELAVLQLLARESPRPLSREDIYRAVWGYEMLHGDRSVDVFVRRIRKKIAKKLPGYNFLHTHYGFGYKFELQRDGGE